jgi:hypothetical protein
MDTRPVTDRTGRELGELGLRELTMDEAALVGGACLPFLIPLIAIALFAIFRPGQPQG